MENQIKSPVESLAWKYLTFEGDDQGVITDSQKAIFKSFPFLLFRPREEDVQLDL